MPAELDALELKISANSTNAAQNIDKLIGSLERLDTVLSFSNSDKYSASMSDLSTSVLSLKQTIDSIDSKKFKGVASAIGSLARSASKLSGLQSAGEAVNKVFSEGIRTDKSEDALLSEIESLEVTRDTAIETKKALRDALNGARISIPSDLWKEYPDDAKSIRAKIGIGNTSNQSYDYTDIIKNAIKQSGAGDIDNVMTQTEAFVSLSHTLSDLDTIIDNANRQLVVLQQQLDYASQHAGEAANSISEVIDGNSFMEAPDIDLSGDDWESQIFGMSDEAQEVTQNIQTLDTTLENLSVNPILTLSEALKSLEGINIPDMTNLSNLAASVGKLGGSYSGGAAMALPQIADGLRSLSGVTIPNLDGIDILAQNLARLGYKSVGNAANNLPFIAQGLEQLGHIQIPNIEGLDALATSISRFGYKSTTAAVENIPKLGTAFSQLIATLSSAPTVSQSVIDLANALANLASAGGSAGAAISAISPRVNSFSNNAKKATKTTFSFAAAIGKIYASYWLLFRVFSKLGSSIELASNLVEVQNVVDTVFTDATNKVQDFADSAMLDFGMTELTAKQFSSRFQAMGTAMGITNEQVASASEYLTGKLSGLENAYKDLGGEMADVSVNLTKLAADMGSFYNLEYEDVAEDLESIFTGMTRPLRAYGLDLTQATLKEYAMRNGLNADIESMTQAEKTMLRYQYVMDRMGHVMGDFTKTADTWANVTRTIGQQFQKLGSLIGTGLINTFKPALIRVRDFLNTLIDLVEKGLNAIGKLLGWQIEIQDVGLTMDDDMEDYADSVGDAAGNAKKLKDYLLGIDELNVLSPDDSGSGSGGGDTTSGGGASEARATGAAVSFEKYKSDIASWFDLGRTISSTLADAMRDIDWESIFDKARNFGTDFANFLNGLITPDLFYQLGRTIANALNTAIYASVSFAETANWEQFGAAIAANINGFFDNFDFKEFAHSINLWVEGILDMFITAVDRVNWDKVGRKIGEFLVEIDFVGILKRVGKLIWKALNAAIDAYAATFKTAPFETALLTLVGLTKLLNVSTIANFAKKMSELSGATTIFASALKQGYSPLTSLGTAVPSLGRAFDTVRDSVLAFHTSMEAGEGVVAGLDGAFTTLGSTMSPLVKVVGTIAAGIADFELSKDAVYDITEGIGSLAGNIAELAGGVAIAGTVFSMVFGFPAGFIAAGVLGAIGAVKGLYDATQDLSEQHAIAAITEEVQGASYTLDDLTNAVKNDVDAIAGSLGDVKDKFDLALSNRESLESIVPEFDNVVNALQYQSNITSAEIDDIIGSIGNLRSAWQDYITSSYDATIAQTMADMEYLRNTGQLTAELEEEYLKRIASLTDEKNTLISDSEEKITAIENEANAYSEAVATYGEDSEQAKLALSGLQEAMNGATDAMRDMGYEFAETPDYISGVADSISDLQGQLDLSQENIGSYEDYAASIGAASQQVADTISVQKEAVAAEIEAIDEQLKTATGEQKAALESSKSILEEQNAALDSKTQEVANILQRNIAEQGKSVIETALEDYDNLGFMEKLGLNIFSGVTDAESYAQHQFEEFSKNTIMSDDGAVGKMNEALGLAPEQIWVDDFADEIGGKIFDTQIYGTGEYATFDTDLADNWSEVFNSALDTTVETVEPNFVTAGENISAGITEGMEDVDTETPVKNFFKGVWGNLIAIWGIHSPAETTKPVGENIVLGIFEGFNLVDFSAKMSSWWDDNVAPWFSLEQWLGLGQGIKDGLSQKWTEFSDWWGTTGFSDWWDDKVAPFFSVDTWLEFGENIRSNLNDKWSDFTGWWNNTGFMQWWNDKVSPYFSEEQWTEYGENIRKNVHDKWDEFTGWWNDTGFMQWWNDKVSPYFNKDTWIEFGSNMKSSLDTKWGEFTEWWNNTGFKQWWDDVTEKFSMDSWNFAGIKDGLEAAWNDAVAAVKEIWNRFASWVNEHIKIDIPAVTNPLTGEELFGSVSIGLTIPTFRTGGFIDVPSSSYSIFAAGEGGIPEMLGTVGGRNAVAGGAEITGIRSAVETSSEREAVLIQRLIEVEETLISVVESKELSVGDREIALANTRGQRMLGYQLRTA